MDKGGGGKTGSSTAGGGPVFPAAPAKTGAVLGRLKPVAQLPPTSPSRSCGKGAVSNQSRTWAARPPSSGPSSLYPSVHTHDDDDDKITPIL